MRVSTFSTSAMRREDGRHLAVVVDRHAGHLAATGGHRFESVRERKHACRHERGVLAQAVAHDHVGGDSVGPEQARQGDVGGEDGGLGDGGLLQVLFGLGHGRSVGRVHEDVLAQGPAQERRHHAVGLVERLPNHRLAAPQAAEHVDVLRALARVQEGHLRGWPAAAEDPLRA